MKTKSLSIILTAIAMLSACGGTNPSLDTSNRLSLTTDSAVTLLSGEAATLSATASSSPSAVTSMSWSALPNGASVLTLSNANCAQRNVNSNNSTLDPSSTWVCPIQITAPTTITVDTNFKLTVTSTDVKGNTTSKDVTVLVKPNNTPAATVSISGPNSVDSGKSIDLNCSAQGGTITSNEKYAYQFVVVDSNGVQGLKLTSNINSPNTATFNSSAVTKATNVIVGCRVTDSSQKTGSSTKSIIINPISSPSLIAFIDDLISVPSGGTINLDGSQSIWYSSSVGALNPQPPIFYYWKQTQGSTAQIVNPNSVRPTVIFPLKSSVNGANRETYAFSLTISDQPFVNGISTGLTSQTTGIYFVNYVSPISISIPTIAPAKSNALANAQILASGQTGQTLYYAWTQVSGPTVTLAGWNTPTVSFLAPTNAGPSNLAIVLRVAVDYVPISSGSSSAYFTDVLIPITP